MASRRRGPSFLERLLGGLMENVGGMAMGHGQQKAQFEQLEKLGLLDMFRDEKKKKKRKNRYEYDEDEYSPDSGYGPRPPGGITG